MTPSHVVVRVRETPGGGRERANKMRLKDLVDAGAPSVEASTKAKINDVLDMIEVMPVLTTLGEKDDYYAGVYDAVRSANVTDKAIVESAVYILAAFVHAQAIHCQGQSLEEQARGVRVSCSALKAIRELQIAASIAEPDGSLLERAEDKAETAEPVAQEGN